MALPVYGKGFTKCLTYKAGLDDNFYCNNRYKLGKDQMKSCDRNMGVTSMCTAFVFIWSDAHGGIRNVGGDRSGRAKSVNRLTDEPEVVWRQGCNVCVVELVRFSLYRYRAERNSLQMLADRRSKGRQRGKLFPCLKKKESTWKYNSQ